MEMSRFLYEVGFFFGARAICNAAAVPRGNANHPIERRPGLITEIPFDFSQKYQTVPRPNRRATVYFGTQLISVGCILLKKISMWALPTVPLFASKSRFFTRNVPLKHSPGWQVCYTVVECCTLTWWNPGRSSLYLMAHTRRIFSSTG